MNFLFIILPIFVIINIIQTWLIIYYKSLIKGGLIIGIRSDRNSNYYIFDFKGKDGGIFNSIFYRNNPMVNYCLFF